MNERNHKSILTDVLKNLKLSENKLLSASLISVKNSKNCWFIEKAPGLQDSSFAELLSHLVKQKSSL